jgi:regulator of sigma E protease
MITTVLAFLVTLGVLIIVHEYGHYRVAVACGVKVLRFSVGFGRPLLRWQRGPTEFVVCALPLGGYVRMLDEREGGVEAGERDQAFNRKPLRQRTAIVAAGPLANLGLAVLLLAASHWIGVDEPKAVLGTPAAGSLAQAADLRAGDWVRAVATADGEWEEVESLTDLRWRVTRAAQAGLAKGDRVLAINGEPVGDAQSLRDRIRAAVVGGQAQRLLWRIERAGSVREIEVQPRLVDDNGQPRGRIDAYVGGAPEMVTVRRGPIDGVVQGTERTWEIATLTVRMIGRMLIGEASVKNLSGPLTIADAAGQSAERGLAYYLGFLALVSVSLGVLNLLPLPMLDGGHLMYYLFEGVTGRPVSEIWLARLQRGGIAVLLVMMSVALFNDVARLLGLH